MIDIAYVPTMCNHCDDAPCIKAAQNGAIAKREDGIVIIDPVKAKELGVAVLTEDEWLALIGQES